MTDDTVTGRPRSPMLTETRIVLSRNDDAIIREHFDAKTVRQHSGFVELLFLCFQPLVDVELSLARQIPSCQAAA